MTFVHVGIVSGPDWGTCQALPVLRGWSSKLGYPGQGMPVLWKEVQQSRGRSKDGVGGVPYAVYGVGGRLIRPCLESQLSSSP